ncbi:MAG TPA: LysM peptidoglycan-binding domain-containing protein [Spirochaetota bacterium]|nr:LysM peptidoglycan-binding domain-containing protein [Spirochaetota bacterium]HOM38484.1 LysM peptidoglycan-binding domain-containing protein [Spirochaetota bacterium]HPQ49024.1 LysM peptidoglycan-binding domain-containing protein [Spirochaetota bacterium]
MKFIFVFYISIFIYLNLYSEILEYKIKKNDSLLSVCANFNVDCDELRKINDSNIISRFWEGDIIKVPLNGYKIESYTVKKGDTIFDLVNKYNIDINLLYALNDTNILNRLWVGDRIFIPIKTENTGLKNSDNKILHKVKKGETLFSISSKYNVSFNQLLKKYGETIYEGQVLEIEKEHKSIIEPLLSFSRKNINFCYPIKTYISKSKQNVYSPISGKVIGIRTLKGFGKAVFIEDNNITTILTSKGLNVSVKYGDIIKKGDIIGDIDKNYVLSFIIVDDNEFITLRELIDERS